LRTVFPARRHDPPRGLRPATRKVPPTKWWAVTEMPRRRTGIARTQRAHSLCPCAPVPLCARAPVRWYAGTLVRLCARAPVRLRDSCDVS
jgi:hypothetical protein